MFDARIGHRDIYQFKLFRRFESGRIELRLQGAGHGIAQRRFCREWRVRLAVLGEKDLTGFVQLGDFVLQLFTLCRHLCDVGAAISCR